MKRVHPVVTACLLAGCLVAMSACHGDRRMTFVNQSTQERLELFTSKSIKNIAINTFHGVQLGNYSLGNQDQEIAIGQYVWQSDSINLEPPTTCQGPDGLEQSSDSKILLFRPCVGERTTVVLKFAEDGSLRDTAGNIWKPAVVERLVVKVHQPAGN